jgi:hypothetical protein
MEVTMKESIRFFAPLCAVMVVMLGVQWAGSAPLPSGTVADPGNVTVTPFEYFPAKFAMDAAESSEPVPTF